MNQDNREHEIRSPAVQGADKPSEAYLLVQNLQTTPGLAGRGHIDECEENSSDVLQPEGRHRGAPEDVEPACRIPRDRVVHRLADRSPKLNPLVEPGAELLHQA